jgi:hypothetical protein
MEMEWQERYGTKNTGFPNFLSDYHLLVAYPNFPLDQKAIKVMAKYKKARTPQIGSYPATFIVRREIDISY